MDNWRWAVDGLRFRWALGVLLLLGAVWLIALNDWIVVQRLVLKRKRLPSWLPLIGGCLGMLAFLILPVAVARQYWRAPLLVDWGCIPGLLYTAVVLLWMKFRGSGQAAVKSV